MFGFRFGFKIIGALLLAAVAHFPTSDGVVFCTVCSAPEPLHHGCAQVVKCKEMCVYFIAGDPEMNHWQCFEDVPQQWSGVNVRGRWTTKTENFIISHEYYPHEISHPNPWIHAAYTCTTDYCNDYTDSNGRKRSSRSSAMSITIQQKFRVCLALLFTVTSLSSYSTF